MLSKCYTETVDRQMLTSLIRGKKINEEDDLRASIKLAEYLGNKSTIPTTYKRPDYCPQCGSRVKLESHCQQCGNEKRALPFGRQYAANPSLQTLPKEIRRQVIHNTTDIDIVNCHPSLTLALAHKYNIDAPAILNYVDNRDNILVWLARHYNTTEKACKTLVIEINYGASLIANNNAYDNWCKTNNVQTTTPPRALIAYADECKKIRRTVIGSDESKALGLDKFSYESRAYAIYLQIIESDILTLAEVLLAKQHKQPSVLMFDGFMIEGQLSESFIDSLTYHTNNTVCKKKYGLDINLSYHSTFFD